MGKEVTTVEIATIAIFKLILSEQEAQAIAMIADVSREDFVRFIEKEIGSGNREGWKSFHDQAKELKRLGQQVEQARDTIRANKVAEVILR